MKFSDFTTDLTKTISIFFFFLLLYNLKKKKNRNCSHYFKDLFSKITVNKIFVKKYYCYYYCIL